MTVHQPEMLDAPMVELNRRYLFERAYRDFSKGTVVRIYARMGHSRDSDWPKTIFIYDENFGKFKLRFETKAEALALGTHLVEFDHYAVDGAVFNYTTKTGAKVSRTFKGDISAVLFAHNHIYLAEAKGENDSLIHCVDEELNDVWIFQCKQPIVNHRYDSFSAEPGLVVLTTYDLVTTFDAETGRLISSYLNK